MKLIVSKFFLFVLLVIPQCIVCAGGNLKKSDIRPTMDQLFHYHYEHKKLSPILVERGVKIFLHQFDPEKLYLLHVESHPYQRMTKRQKEKIIQGFYNGDFSYFEEIRENFAETIIRARLIREEVRREIVLSDNWEEALGETYFDYPKSREELKKRIKRQQLYFLKLEKEFLGLNHLSPEKKEKILMLWEKRIQRREEAYINVELSEHHLATQILKSLAMSLDAHTLYFTPGEAEEMRRGLEKEFEGVGVSMRESVDGVIIAGVMKGSPAEQCGMIEKGDFLLAIDGKSVIDVEYEQVLQWMRNDQKYLHLTLAREGAFGEPMQIDVELKREKFALEDERLKCLVEPYDSGFLVTLVLPSFYESQSTSCEKDIRIALAKVRENGEIKGLVLDLRNNLGGFFVQAVKVAGLFVSSGVIAISKYSGGETKYLRSIDGKIQYDGPMVVLTSRASASAAEIVAQALQDYGAAIVVGDERTYGKGTIQIQTVTDPKAKAYFKVTVGKYYTVSGRSTQIDGVRADIVVPTEYSRLDIGEKFLEYPLEADHIPPAFEDTLSDLDLPTRLWFEKNYLPNLHQKSSYWHDMLPILRDKSKRRMQQSKEFTAYLEQLSHPREKRKEPSADYPLLEAHEILKDMIDIEVEVSTSPRR